MNVKLCLADPNDLGEVASFQRKVFASTSGQEIDAKNVRKESADLILDNDRKPPIGLFVGVDEKSPSIVDGLRKAGFTGGWL